MKTTEVFKSDSEEKRRKAVTDILIQYEENRRKAAEKHHAHLTRKAKDYGAR